MTNALPKADRAVLEPMARERDFVSSCDNQLPIWPVGLSRFISARYCTLVLWSRGVPELDRDRQAPTSHCLLHDSISNMHSSNN